MFNMVLLLIQFRPIAPNITHIIPARGRVTDRTFKGLGFDSLALLLLLQVAVLDKPVLDHGGKGWRRSMLSTINCVRKISVGGVSTWSFH